MWRRILPKKEGNRLPSGQILTRSFPVLHYGPIPEVDLSTWSFKIFGLVEEEKVWSWEEFQRLPRTRIKLDIHCVTRWSKFDTEWEGVSVKTLVEEGYFKPLPQARFVIQHCESGFTTNTPLELTLQKNFILATHYDGKPLTLEHGFPLRGVIGTIQGEKQLKTAYFWKGGKWLRALEFSERDKLGFWERNGYHNEADPWKEQRFASRRV